MDAARGVGREGIVALPGDGGLPRRAGAADRRRAGEPDEEVVVFNTGAAQKYPEAVPLTLPRLAKDGPIDWAAVTGVRTEG